MLCKKANEDVLLCNIICLDNSVKAHRGMQNNKSRSMLEGLNKPAG